MDGITYSPEILNYYMEYFSLWAGLPAKTLQVVARIETSYNPQTGFFYNVCNSVKACGLMQLKPIALQDIYNHYGFRLDPLNPIQAIVGAALMFKINRKYLIHYTKQNPDFWALVIAYNGGWTQGRNYMLNRPIGAEQLGYARKGYIYFYGAP